jgi:hypothetical protein
MKLLYKVIFLFIAAFVINGCSKDDSNPTQSQNGNKTIYKENKKTLTFSGFTWYIKGTSTASASAPGPNYWTDNDSDVYVDNLGKLHMKIVYRDGHWRCTQIYTASKVSYGTFNFVIDSGLDGFDPNAVLGLFTWNNDTYNSDANSEIDIEMSNWTEPGSKILNYSVQPTSGPDVTSGHYTERYRAYNMKLFGQTSFHTFTWTDSLISFAGYFGNSANSSKMFSQFSFSNKNIARRGNSEGTYTNPVLIPHPSTATTLDVNLWLVNGITPYYNKAIEIVISKIEYIKSTTNNTSVKE